MAVTEADTLSEDERRIVRLLWKIAESGYKVETVSSRVTAQIALALANIIEEGQHREF